MRRADAKTDYYELLQISRNAEMETIHRVYRIMAARFHPDNAKTGDPEMFLLLTRAYQTLSDATLRMQYDAILLGQEAEPLPVFQLKDFLHGVEGEKNRRLGVLSLLYVYRRRSETRAGVSVLDLEKRMAFPREYLNFTLWYLKRKGYIATEENSDYSLTAEGVDFVESQSSNNAIIRQLLTPAAEADAKAPANENPAHLHTALEEASACFDEARRAA